MPAPAVMASTRRISDVSVRPEMSNNASRIVRQPTRARVRGCSAARPHPHPRPASRATGTPGQFIDERGRRHPREVELITQDIKCAGRVVTPSPMQLLRRELQHLRQAQQYRQTGRPGQCASNRRNTEPGRLSELGDRPAPLQPSCLKECALHAIRHRVHDKWH